jgi:nucleoside-diphosphate-sugar epimerase
VVCDVYAAAAVKAALLSFDPELVMHQLTDLPDDASRLRDERGANARIRREGTRNLLEAASAAGVQRFIAQSVAWTIPGDGGAAVAEMEQMVLAADGLILRYGQFYGQGTYHPSVPPPPPRVDIDDAAARTVAALETETGIVTILDD